MVCTGNRNGLVCRLRKYLSENLSHARCLHSELVASCAASLCIRFGCDQESGFLAGLAHDIAREMPGDDILRMLEASGVGLSPEERSRPVLAHGRAGEILLAGRFGVSDPDILEAVRCHTLGCPGMGKLAMVVFCADELEPGRQDVPEEWRNRVLGLGLERMTARIMEKTFGYLREKGRAPAEVSSTLYRELSGL